MTSQHPWRPWSWPWARTREFAGDAQAEGAPAQEVRRIVWSKAVVLNVETEEDLDLQIAALDALARQHLGRHFGTDHPFAAETTGVVAVEVAGEHELEVDAVLIDSAWRQ